jgi:hypothetical protein
VSGAAASRPGWPARRAALPSPGEMAWRPRGQVVRAAWPPRRAARRRLALAAAPPEAGAEAR